MLRNLTQRLWPLKYPCIFAASMAAVWQGKPIIRMRKAEIGETHMGLVWFFQLVLPSACQTKVPTQSGSWP